MVATHLLGPAQGLLVGNHYFDYQEIASFDVDAQKGFTFLCPEELPVIGGDEIGCELNAQKAFARYRLGSKDGHSAAAVWTATAEHPAHGSGERAGDLARCRARLDGHRRTVGAQAGRPG